MAVVVVVLVHLLTVKRSLIAWHSSLFVRIRSSRGWTALSFRPIEPLSSTVHYHALQSSNKGPNSGDSLLRKTQYMFSSLVVVPILLFLLAREEEQPIKAPFASHKRVAVVVEKVPDRRLLRGKSGREKLHVWLAETGRGEGEPPSELSVEKGRER